jgi:hypothetical protein
MSRKSTVKRGRKTNQQRAEELQILQTNPFRIDNTVKLFGNRSRKNNPLVKQLGDCVLQLAVDPTQSVLIPKTLCPTKNQAIALILAVKRYLKLEKKAPSNFYITMRSFHDDKGDYVASRLWRLS